MFGGLFGGSDQKLVNDERKLVPLCDQIEKTLKGICDSVDKNIENFRGNMHSICADKYMAAATKFTNLATGQEMDGFTMVIRQIVKEKSDELSHNLNVLIEGIYDAMIMVLKAHGHQELPKKTKTYSCQLKEVATFYGTLPDGGEGIPERGNASQMAQDSLKELQNNLNQCKEKLINDMKTNLTGAFQEESIQNATNKLADEVINVFVNGVDTLMKVVGKLVQDHVDLLSAAKDAATQSLSDRMSATQQGSTSAN